MKDKLKHFFLLTASTLIMAVGVYFFKFANNFTFGGITGLAVLIAKTGIMSAGDFTFITNMLLLVLGFIILGSKFAAKTAYCSILLSVALSALERIFQCRTRSPISRCSNSALRSHFRRLVPQFCLISDLPAAAPTSLQ